MTTDSPSARIVLGALRLYKVLISPLFAGSCRYLPPCSDYMAEAVRRHGVVSGVFLGLKRLGRCHPFGGSGLDPVPEKPGSGTRDPGPVLRSETPACCEGTAPEQRPRANAVTAPEQLRRERGPSHNWSPAPGPRSLS